MFSWLNRFQPLGEFLMRLALGSVMISKGYAKVIPHGALDHFTHIVTHLGLPAALAYVAAFTEFFGGMLLIVGLGVRIVALLVTCDMAVAIFKVTVHQGMSGNSYLPLSLCCIALAVMLLFTGGGWLALDSLVGKGKSAARR